MCLIYRAIIAVYAVLLSFLCVSSGSSDSVRIDIGYKNVDFVRSKQGVESAATDRQTLDSISISGFSSSISSGNPALPCKLIYVALPPDADISSVRIDANSYSTQILGGEYDIAPVPAAATADGTPEWGPDKQIIDGRNTLIYNNNNFYPAQHIRVRDVGKMRSWKIATIEYWPYCFNPATGNLRAVEANDISVSYDITQSDISNSTFDPIAASMSDFVSNQPQATNWYSSAAAGILPCYIILTTQAIASTSSKLNDFINYQILRGFNVKVVTEDEWGGGRGDLAANNIRKWLQDNYQSLNIEYVLLIGNPIPADGDVPMKLLWPRKGAITGYEEAPSDLYYADLSGNWDINGNGFAGEYPKDFVEGGIDKFPEVYVGRIPYYGSIADLDHILQKTMDYGSTPPPAWRKQLLLPMKPLDPYTPAYQLGEQIKEDIAGKLGYSTTRLYDSTYNLNPQPERIPCDYSPVHDEWNKGAGLVFWMSHGSTNLASGIIYSSICSNLDDSKPSIVYQGSCYNGEPEDPNNLGYSLLRNGAITTVSASRVSWYYMGETVFTNIDSIGGIGYQYAKFLLTQKDSSARALMNSYLAVPPTLWANQLVFNLYGDPSTKLEGTAAGGLIGKITSPEGVPIEGALISSASGNKSNSSGQDGSYKLAGFDSGPQDILITAAGCYPRHIYNVPIKMGKFTQLDTCVSRAVCGSISGNVRDIYGVPIGEAKVTVSTGEHSLYTQSDGSFQFNNLPPGKYTLTLSKYPYAEKCIYDVEVRENRDSHVEITLQSILGNTIVNGDFELGFCDLPNMYGRLSNFWQFSTTPGYPGKLLEGSYYHKFGSCSQKLYLPQPAGEGHSCVYQVVDVVPGTSYSLTAWARSHFTGDENSSDENIVCRLGCDPTGGTNFNSPQVVWLEFGSDHDFWFSLFKTIVPYSQSVTVFLDAWRKLPAGGDDCYAYFDGVGLTGPAKAPSVPRVLITCQYQCDKTSISASWSSSDLDISAYEYAVSTTPDESGIVPGGGWQNVGSSTNAFKTGLNLQNGESVRVLVRAINGAGLKSEIGASESVKIVEDVSSVAQARRMSDGLWVRIGNLCVTRMGFSAECFVQDLSRAAGIKVSGALADIPYLQPGTLTSVIGRLSTNNGVRVLVDSKLLPSILGASPRPLGMPNSNTGANHFGLVPHGLLVSVWGRVGITATASESGCFNINDGSTKEGIIIECFNSAIPPPAGSYVRLTGISTTNGVAVYSADDITQISQ